MTRSTTPRSHPSDAMLLRYGVGGYGPVFRAAIAAHAADCARCAALLREGEAIGGALLADIPETTLAPGALDAVLARLDEPAPPSVDLPALLAQRTWPVAPGVRHARLLAAEGESLHLFRVYPGAGLPRHDHNGDELTCVLAGAFEDVTGSYTVGDAVPLRPGLAHEPVAIGEAECVCLLAVTGRLRFATLIPRLVQRLLGL